MYIISSNIIRKKFYKKPWIKELRKYDDKFLVMLSGGSDSALALGVLKSLEFEVEAVHFKNKWSWRLSEEEAVRICNILNVNLNIYDVTKDFVEHIADEVIGRPCLECKTIMNEKAIEHCLKYDFSWIVEGDIAFDSSLKKISTYERRKSDLYITRYLDCAEKNIKLPEAIRILRPIIELKPYEVENILLEGFDIKVRKNYEIGDKYNLYWREGCPLQYVDDEKLTLELMDKLHHLNSEVAKYARENGIRASIFLPSEKIITIPNGFEGNVRKYLFSKTS